MEHKDEFSKWMSTVEEALSNEDLMPSQNTPMGEGECGCGCWDCSTCFPAQDEMPQMTGDNFGGFGGGVNDDQAPDAALVIGGVDVQDPTDVHPEIHGGRNNDPMNIKLQGGMDEIEADEFMGLEEVGMMDEEEMDFEEKPQKGRNGGVKLGDIVSKTEFVPTGGQNSPMTYGEDNLDEEGSDIEMGEQPGASEDPHNLIAIITNMQDMGLSNSDHAYSREELSMMTPEQLEQVHSEVTGTFSEATGPKPTRTKTHPEQDIDPYGDLDDILTPRQAHLPAEFGNDEHDVVGGEEPMHLPAASRASTQGKMQNMSPSEIMRNMMNRISPEAGAGEGELELGPDHSENEMVVRSARDVPTVISNAMQASGMQTPEWHHVNNLPGFNDRNIRGMGKQIFGMFTNTPIGEIQTMANVDGQGPNTPAEMRAVAAWLRDTAEDLGEVKVNHGMAIPGYKPDVKEYRANGVRFHVVRDPMGQYIYAYPDKDAKTSLGSDQTQGPQAISGNMPRIGESSSVYTLKYSLFEQLQWNEEINEILKETMIDEEDLDEASTLSQKIGKMPNGRVNQGGQNLVKLLHAKHKLGSEADLRQMPFDKELLATQFKKNPDNFIIVQGTDGVAGIKPSKEYVDNMTKRYAAKNKTYNPSTDYNLKYQVVAFKNDGEKLDSSLFRAPARPGDEDGYDDERITDPTVIRTRVGRVHGKDHNPENIFSKLSEEIGTLKYVWVTGFWGTRGGKGEPQDIEPSVGSVERDKIDKRANMKAQPSMPTEEAAQKIFKRISSTLKPVADRVDGKLSQRLQKAAKAGNRKEVAAINTAGEIVDAFKVALNTSKEVSMTGMVGRKFRNALEMATGIGEYDDRFGPAVSELARGNSAALFPVVKSLGKVLLGAVQYVDQAAGQDDDGEL